jgi:hypothetical protein
MCKPRKMIICDSYGECLWTGVIILKMGKSLSGVCRYSSVTYNPVSLRDPITTLAAIYHQNSPIATSIMSSLQLSSFSSSFSSSENIISSSPPWHRPSASNGRSSSPLASSATAAGDQPCDEAWWARFSGHIMATTSSERSWWWEHGYRLCQVDNALPLTSRHVWVCKICVAKRKPPSITYYRYIASTGKSVIRHLRDHRITRANIVGRDDRRPTNQNSMAQYLQTDVNNP